MTRNTLRKIKRGNLVIGSYVETFTLSYNVETEPHTHTTRETHMFTSYLNLMI